MHQRPPFSLETMVNSVRRFVKDYAEITAPLVRSRNHSTFVVVVVIVSIKPFSEGWGVRLKMPHFHALTLCWRRPLCRTFLFFRGSSLSIPRCVRSVLAFPRHACVTHCCVKSKFWGTIRLPIVYVRILEVSQHIVQVGEGLVVGYSTVSDVPKYRVSSARVSKTTVAQRSLHGCTIVPLAF